MKETYKDVKHYRGADGRIIYEEEITCCSHCDCQIPPDVFQVPCDACITGKWEAEHYE